MAKLLVAILGSIGLVGVTAAMARGDTVRLRNGDVLSGKVAAFTTEELKLETSYAGTVVIASDEVASVETSEPVVVKLEGGRESVGRIVVAEDGDLRIQEDAGDSVKFDLAQIVSFAPPKPPKPWFRYQGEVNAGFNAASGNTRTQGYHVDGVIKPVLGKNSVFMKGQLNRSEAEVETSSVDGAGNPIVVDETTESNWRVLAQYQRELTEHWYLFVNNGWENDDLRDLHLRLTAATGAGYKFWDDEIRFLSVELGPGFVHENFKVGTPGRDYATARWALDFDHGVFNPAIRFYHNHIILDRVDKLEAFVLQSATGLKVPLIANVNAAAEVQLDWNNDPAQGAGEDDLRYLLKIGYAF